FSRQAGDRRDLPSFPTRRSSDLLHATDVIGQRNVLRVRVILCGSKAQQFGDLLLVGEILADAFLQHATELGPEGGVLLRLVLGEDRKSTRLNSSHVKISYAVFCL